MRNINFIKSGMRGYAAAECDYAIMNSVFVPRKVLDLFYHPRKPIKGAIHYEKVGSNPICVVMDKYPADAQGIRLAMEGRYGEALPVLEDAYNYNPNNFGLWRWLGLAYYHNKKYDDAIKFLTRSSQFWPAGDEAVFDFAHIGAAQVEQKDYDKALYTLGQAAKASGGNPNISAFIAVNMGVAHYHKGQHAQALPYLESALGQYPRMRGLVEFCRARAK